ncbi:ribonuclease H-like domain-containing protein [Xylariales sp. AK1849]|nr:ribonuclease H-like domain-containing protein [Xylariales sp. AK1849]
MYNAGEATSQRAELWAAIHALRVVQRLAGKWPDISDGGYQLDKVVVKADSEYVIKGMTQWIFKWMGNGWTNARGRPLVNRDLFQKLVQQVRTLRGLGVYVQFWHVPREDNKEADDLANRELYGWVA